ncbi:redoxin family protein [Azoarcus sp. TTM-91]|uniref:TlpA family protein disulfide reductase n=1 Tax=Azoarcus sp. TTM-91 TaxID=2691581 RepID=UPI00145EAC1F|nr:TlpA disulfide reductase family protein [Azoarcus sp. TTM-91]NMG32951.1 redoxin family protein [Azoarcus sp. TTM-91]
MIRPLHTVLRGFAAGLLGLALAAPAAALQIEALEQLPPPSPALAAALEAARGKAVVVNFWASWCEPCRDEMPGLVQFDESEPGIALITVAVADRAADSRRFLDDYLLEQVVLIADPDQSIARNWGVKMIPTSVVLDAAHKPRLRIRGEADWHDAALRERVRAFAAPAAKTPANPAAPTLKH